MKCGNCSSETSEFLYCCNVCKKGICKSCLAKFVFVESTGTPLCKTCNKDNDQHS